MRFGSFLRERRVFRSAIATVSYRGVRRIASALGFQVVLKTFYSPIPDLGSLPDDIFDRRSSLPGIEFDLSRQLDWVRTMHDAMAEFSPRREPDPGARNQYARRNPSYGCLDASILYAVIRTLKPKRIIELGSGHSTLVAAEGVRRNAAEGSPARFEAWDPHASVVDPSLPGLTALHAVPAQDVPIDLITALDSNDILFVDTTHTVKLGSDVVHIVLEVLPRLRSGVHVHFHDIFFPYEYPRRWIEDYGLFWAEQYLMQAFLAFNSDFEVLYSAAALGRDRRKMLRPLLPKGIPPKGGSALWIRRR